MTIVSRKAVAAPLLAVLVASAGLIEAGHAHDPVPADAQRGGTTRSPLFSIPLPDAPGKVMSAVLLTYAPGAATAVHDHPGTTVVYVLDGAIRSQIEGEPAAATYRAGQVFIEKPRAGHLVSENASATEPAKFLAIFISDEGEPVTRMRR